MPLVLAIRNRESIVVASDTATSTNQEGAYGQFIPLPNRSAILIVGNLEAVKHAVMTTVMPKVHPKLSAAALAQLLQAALVLEVVPKLQELKGRVEIVVAGIDPVRHVAEPDLYYMDSAQDFYLKVVEGDAVAAGATAAVTALLAGHDFSHSDTSFLKVLAKESVSSTKLRWPQALANHVEIGVITAEGTHVQVY